MDRQWQARSAERMPDTQWAETMNRVRAEFEEMPCLRVTLNQARLLFGLSDTMSVWVLGRLAEDGFLDQNVNGEYVRRNASP